MRLEIVYFGMTIENMYALAKDIMEAANKLSHEEGTNGIGT